MTLGVWAKKNSNRTLRLWYYLIKLKRNSPVSSAGGSKTPGFSCDELLGPIGPIFINFLPGAFAHYSDRVDNTRSIVHIPVSAK